LTKGEVSLNQRLEAGLIVDKSRAGQIYPATSLIHTYFKQGFLASSVFYHSWHLEMGLIKRYFIPHPTFVIGDMLIDSFCHQNEFSLADKSQKAEPAGISYAAHLCIPSSKLENEAIENNEKVVVNTECAKPRP
jgi:hypothetical protein